MKKISLLMLLMLLGVTLPSAISAASGDLDASFRPPIGAIGFYDLDKAYALQTDGKILVGGEFTFADGELTTGLIRLNANGTRDTSFRANLYGTVERIFPQPDAKILVSGLFTEAGVFRGFLRLNADGSRDTGFNLTATSGGAVYAVAFQPDGKILVGGDFPGAVLRLNADGSLDPTFNAGVLPNTSTRFSQILDLLLAPDGKVYIGGRIYTSGSPNGLGFARLNADGTPDTTFLAQFSSSESIGKIVRQTDGKILIGGAFDTIQGIARPGFARLNVDGTIDQSFVPPSQFYRGGPFALLADGKILATWTLNNPISNRLARLNPNGSFDASFTEVSEFRAVIGILPNGEILAAARAAIVNNLTYIRILRLNANGSLNRTIEVMQAKAGTVRAILRQPDGKIVIAGAIGNIGAQYVPDIARLNPDGSRDASFNPVSLGSGRINALALQPDGKILVAGGFFEEAEANSRLIVRLNSDGSLDSSFNSGRKTGGANTIALQADGKIYLGGDFYYLHNGGQIPSFVRLNPDGSLDTSFTLRPGNNSSVRKIIVQPDGKILVAGNITSGFAGGNFRFDLERLNPNNTIDTTFSNSLITNTTFAQKVSALALQPDGKILYGDAQLKRLNENGSDDNSFVPPVISYPSGGSKEISEILVQPTGKIIIGGFFNGIADGTNSLNQPHIARLNSNGTIDSSLTPLIEGKTDGAPYLSVAAVTVEPNGRILIGGSFIYVNGVTQPGLARLTGDATSAARPLFDFDGDGKADVSVFRPSTGAWFLNQSANGFAGVQFGFGTDKIVPADYDGDGKTDVAVYRPANGTWYLNRSQAGFTGVQFGAAEDIPVPADFDGDGKADVAVFRPSNGTWYINRSQLGFTGFQFGQNGDRPVVGDYDGDGKADYAVFRPAGGVWYIERSRDHFTSFQFGRGTDELVPADYDGDGKTDVAVYRGGAWYIERSRDHFAFYQFGATSDTPAPADFDGDGKTDLGVFRPSNGTWYLNRSQSGLTGIQFGTSEDRPVPNAFVP